MTLAAGTRLGRYEILGPIGAGGMGEVYRARDPRLERDVALKILPAELAADPDRLSRFEREARAASALSHPNVLEVFDVGEHEGTHYVVTELLEGETLRERLQSGALPLRMALDYAGQIAEGLAAAHDAGVVHRDLKPENLLVTGDGRVKILDFGLAKLVEHETPRAEQGDTVTRDTQAGQTLGTAGYMSPEQVRGQPVDHRADVFGFGAVLYEMLTGERAFHGATTPETLTAILNNEPTERPGRDGSLPQPVSTILRRCLEKVPDQRFHSMHDLAFALKTLADPTGRGPTGAEAVGTKRQPSTILLVLTSLVVGALVGGMSWMRWTGTSESPTVRFDVTLPPTDSVPPDVRGSVAVSPDGRQLVYVARRDGVDRLYKREIDAFESHPLPGTDNAYGPFFSPDGRWLGFFSDGKLRRLSFLEEEAPQPICDSRAVLGASWGEDDTIVFALGAPGLFSVPATGGTPVRIATPDQSRDEQTYRWPIWLPDDRGILFTIGLGSGFADSRISVLRPGGGAPRTVAVGGTNASYAATGHLLIARNGNLTASPFDLRQLEVSGPAVPLISGIATPPAHEEAFYSLSSSGAMVYVPAGERPGNVLQWVDRTGAVSALIETVRAYENPRLSPSGDRVAVSALVEGRYNVWILDLARGVLTALTSEGDNRWPTWTPDGSRVVFSSVRGGGAWALYWAPADASGPVELLAKTGFAMRARSWSPDGRRLAFEERRAETLWDIGILDVENPSEPEHWLATPSNELGAAFSPDGRWIAFSSDISGRTEVYLRSFPGQGRRWQVSKEGGGEVTWSRDGHELFYRHRNRLMQVGFTGLSAPVAPPRALFEGQFVRAMSTGTVEYDAGLDGERFLMLQSSREQSSPDKINVILNWTQELRDRVPSPGS